MKEASLYPIVESFLLNAKTGMDCFEASRLKGTNDLGIADVTGVRHVGLDRSNSFEVITVEVKKNSKAYGKKIGEALGYSLFAHRCYFAACGTFSSLQKQFAAQLGVGLLEINGRKCREVLAATSHQPNEHQMLSLLKSMGLRRCSICGALKRSKHARVAHDASAAIRKNIPYVLHKTSIGDGNLVLCPECVDSMQGIGTSIEDAISKLRTLVGSRKVWNLFLSLRNYIKGLGSDVEELPSQWRLAFAREKAFFYVYPKQYFISYRIAGAHPRNRVSGKRELKKAEQCAREAYKKARRS